MRLFNDRGRHDSVIAFGDDRIVLPDRTIPTVLIRNEELGRTAAEAVIEKIKSPRRRRKSVAVACRLEGAESVLGPRKTPLPDATVFRSNRHGS